ncbi:MAG: hypothetical protein ACRDGU_02430 [Actinomycetota bacterium]
MRKLSVIVLIILFILVLLPLGMGMAMGTCPDGGGFLCPTGMATCLALLGGLLLFSLAVLTSVPVGTARAKSSLLAWPLDRPPKRA